MLHTHVDPACKQSATTDDTPLARRWCLQPKVSVTVVNKRGVSKQRHILLAEDQPLILDVYGRRGHTLKGSLSLAGATLSQEKGAFTLLAADGTTVHVSHAALADALRADIEQRQATAMMRTPAFDATAPRAPLLRTAM